MSGTTPRRRHGLAGLLVILFVVGGLVSSYGLRHAPAAHVCTEHAVSVPVSAVSSLGGPPASPGGVQAPEAAVAPPQAAQQAAIAPMEPPQTPLYAGLCLAVLLTLLLLGLTARPGRPAFRLPARVGWALAPPLAGVRTPAPRPALQVLRL